MTKTCSKCQVEKPREAFYKAKHTQDGLQGWCKSCMRDNLKNWRKETKNGKRLLKKGAKNPLNRQFGGAA